MKVLSEDSFVGAKQLTVWAIYRLSFKQFTVWTVYSLHYFIMKIPNKTELQI